ncbi:MAG: DUF4330 domain-containing protein [Clostridia bacterium]|nr:DUF4330 domain-containing protein [Clostridia bacterium]
MEKSKKKFNIIDFIVIVAIIAVLVFVGIKLKGVITEKTEDANSTVKYRLTFYTDESTYFSLKRIENGDPVCDESNNYNMGNVTRTDIKDESEGTLETADGKYVVAPKPGYGSGYITFEGIGKLYDHGAKFEDGLYSVGQTITLRVGDSKVYGRIYDIEQIQ